MKNVIMILLLGVSMNLFSKTGYKLPPENVRKIYEQKRNPYIEIIHYSNFGLEKQYEMHPSLQDLADEKLKLAGKSFTKKINAQKDFYPTNMINLFDLDNKSRIGIKLPSKARIRETQVSPNQKKLALLNETDAGIELLINELGKSKLKKFSEFKLNDIFGDGFIGWLNDDRHILLKIIPPERATEPQRSAIPDSPIMEETSGKESKVRTYQNLLKNEYDKKLFEHYFSSQLILLDIETGKYKTVGKTAIYDDVEISPDNNFLLITRIEKPYSYNVPYYRFPKTFEIWDLQGKKLKTLYKRPLQEEVPIGGTYIGPRYFSWQPLQDAALIWVEALDEGDPKKEVEHRDKIMRLIQPLAPEPKEILRLEERYSGIDWSQEKNEMIVYEYDRDNLWRKGWLFQIGKEKELIYDLSIRDEYNDPGYLVKKETKHGKWVFVKKQGKIFYINNTGATPEGNYPFLSQYDLTSKKTIYLFRCEKGKHETIQGFTKKDLSQILIRSESNKIQPNYFLIDLKNAEKKQLTFYPNNFQELTALKKELVKYSRADSIPLSGELYLPANYQKGKRLPLVINAYPEEYTDDSTAGQIVSTPNKFIRFWGTSVRYFALEGYAVLTKASIPIVGDPQTVNDTFIEQTVNSVQAAIDYLDKRGIIDPDRVGITGHSYGAFMVANVLANSNICKAGIARSGAYNRTLTPFGFQSERRTFWEARDFYLEVSPLAHAEKIKEPILLIHGEEDPNSGTYPLQSKRFYHALKGNGATARLVLLPLEGHSYRAKKSGLHVLAEMIEWFEKHVKNK